MKFNKNLLKAMQIIIILVIIKDTGSKTLLVNGIKEAYCFSKGIYSEGTLKITYTITSGIAEEIDVILMDKNIT